MKLKINKACDLASISVLPPRNGGSGGVGASASSVVGSQPQQHRSQQTLSQQSFSQGGGASGGGSSLLQSQSQLSHGSLDENILGLHLLSPRRDQRFGSHDGSSNKMSSLPVSSASAVPEDSQLQLAKIPSNPVHRWNPCITDSRCQVPNDEDIERKFQHMASSVHKMEMILGVVQNDCMQLNRAMKEASLDTGSVQQKIGFLENSIQKLLKEQGGLKELVESSIKSNSGQLDILNSYSSKLEVISSVLSVWPKQMQADLKQQQSDILRIFTKEMEGVVRAIRSLSGRPDVMQMPAVQNCTIDERPLMNLQPAANKRPQVNQTPVATLVSQAPAANGSPMVTQTPVANGRSLMSQMPAVNAKVLMSQTPVANGRSLVRLIPTANGGPLTNQEAVASGRCHTNQVPASKVNTAPWACPAKVSDPKPKIEQGNATALPKNLTGSGATKLISKQEQVPNRKVNRQAAPKKSPAVTIIIDSDYDSNVRACCVILNTHTGAGDDKEEESVEVLKEATEESLQILRRARKEEEEERIADHRTRHLIST